MQLIDSSERANTLLSKGPGVGFAPVTSWLRTRGANHCTIAAPHLPEPALFVSSDFTSVKLITCDIVEIIL